MRKARSGFGLFLPDVTALGVCILQAEASPPSPEFPHDWHLPAMVATDAFEANQRRTQQFEVSTKITPPAPSLRTDLGLFTVAAVPGPPSPLQKHSQIPSRK